ncbi:Transposon Ty3-I Gag-Pol polyprotein [Vitis vinifera]|uniref:Transposon Ty3-I Gag-Pol polyprotein n=1 Tax=Vitis vinifera TaxID=29760 RepID=A0A438IV46_VITVI|nr:Transposon Ty3-I Gag-Pol polyprotein [Vitis vinifera]
MSGILPSVTSHRLNVLAIFKPIRQKIRRFHPDRQKVIQEEIEKLLEAGFIREVEYLKWLANVVVVPKIGGKWWVCIDYTNLNDACPKDSFLLPRIDQIVDATSGHEMLSFLDASPGITKFPWLRKTKKNLFITPHRLYCYRVMPFGLKNTGATYQRLMTKIFKPLIGDIIELNPAKCAFGVSSGKFLGFMVTQRGIEINLDQVKAVANMLAQQTRSSCNALTGKLVSLRRFIARFTNKMKPFFLTLRDINKPGWTQSCQNAFEEIKWYLSQPPILSSLQPGERLYLYLAVTEWVVSAVLLRSLSPREQRLVYFISKALPM